MKLLFDQNISPRLVAELNDLFPGSTHVRELNLQTAPDHRIWFYAAEHGFALASKDSDFQQRSFLEGAPPKVIWVNLGNCTTAEVREALPSRSDEILRFNEDAEESFLVISR